MVFRASKYFDFHGIPDAQRVRISGFTMEGKASDWYQWMKRNKLFTTWAAFLRQVELRFGTSRFEDYQGKLSKLMQTTSVTDYQTEFEHLMNKVTGISEAVLISMFVAGLKPHIRRGVQRAKPPSLMEAFAMAREYEAQYEDLQADLAKERRLQQRWQPRPVTPVATGHTTQATGLTAAATAPLTLPPTAAKTTSTPLPIKRLSPQEIREKRAQGLCYNCDQRYTPNHHCRSRFLMLLGTDDEEGNQEEAQTTSAS